MQTSKCAHNTCNVHTTICTAHQTVPIIQSALAFLCPASCSPHSCLHATKSFCLQLDRLPSPSSSSSLPPRAVPLTGCILKAHCSSLAAAPSCNVSTCWTQSPAALETPREGSPRQGEGEVGGGGAGGKLSRPGLRNQMLCPRRAVRHSQDRDRRQ